METNNSHISDFLKYYYELGVEPNYAILIKGPWGCGKTWFIKNFIESFGEEDKKKFIYVSLYGSTSLADVEQAIFQRLHPWLGSKPVTLLTRAVKKKLTGGVNFDVNRDGVSDFNLAAQESDLDMAKYFLDTSNKILVFDDLERSSMKLTTLLGYVNNFIEHKSGKVILLAEEKALRIKSENENKDHSYENIKEKLIGKTFELVSDPVSAYGFFVNTVKDDELKIFYQNQQQLILDIFKRSECENLRLLRHAIMDFERFCSFLPDEAKNKLECLCALCKFFMIFFFEVKSGKIKVNDIQKFSSYLAYMKESKDDEYLKVKNVISKYSDINFSILILNSDDWITFLDKGYCESGSIKAAINNSEYFVDNTAPAWKLLWYWPNLEEDDFKRSLVAVKKDFKERNFKDLHVIKHTVGILLSLSENKLIDEDKKSIINDAKSYIQSLSDSGTLANMELSDDGFSNLHGWGGLAYHDRESSEFIQFSKFLKLAKKKADQNKLPELAADLLKILMDKKSKEFMWKVCVTGNGAGEYYRTPILKHINVIQFVDAVANIPNNNKRDIETALSLRYEIQYRNYLEDEREWLKKVNNQVKKKSVQLAGAVTGVALVNLNKHITELLDGWVPPIKKDKSTT